MDFYTSWWLNTLPPLSGQLRVIFLSGLLTLLLIDKPSPLWATESIQSCTDCFYQPSFFLRWLGRRRPSTRVLRWVTRLTICLWALWIVGFGQPAVGFLTFFGLAFLHGSASGALGSNHSTHAALYSLFALQFSVSYEWSLDAVIFNTPLVAADSPFRSGFAPALALIFLSFTMFAGGVAKIRYGWRGWLTGQALHFYVSSSAPAARWRWLSDTFVNRRWVCRLAGPGALVVELLSVLAIPSSTLRPWLVLSWVALHVAILLVMMPAYWVQMWCYLLLFDWYALLGATPSKPMGAASSAATAFAALGTLAALALILVMVFEIEHWPVTNVPMYSNGTPSPQQVTLPARETLRERATAVVRGRQGQWPRAWVEQESVQDLWLVAGSERIKYWHCLAEKGAAPVRWSQYTKILREMTCRQLATMNSGPDHLAPEVDGFLSRAGALAHAVPSLDRFHEIAIIVSTPTGPEVIARRTIAPTLDDPSHCPTPGLEQE